MRKIIASTFISLDGMMSGINDDQSWITDIFNDEMDQVISEQQAETDAMIIGERSYDILSSFWSTATPDSGEPQETIDHMNNVKKIVFSKDLENPTWNNTEVVRDINKEEIESWKQQDGKNMTIIGSSSIVQQLTNLGLVDEYRLMLHPVILGEGKPLFANIEARHDLALRKSRPLSNGVVVLYYEPKK